MDTHWMVIFLNLCQFYFITWVSNFLSETEFEFLDDKVYKLNMSCAIKWLFFFQIPDMMIMTVAGLA